MRRLSESIHVEYRDDTMVGTQQKSMADADSTFLRKVCIVFLLTNKANYHNKSLLTVIEYDWFQNLNYAKRKHKVCANSLRVDSTLSNESICLHFLDCVYIAETSEKSTELDMYI